MTTQDQQMTEDYADTIAERVRELATGLEDQENWTHPDGPEYGQGEDALYDYMSEWPLELVYEKGQPLAVLVTFGGPNAWLFRDRYQGDRIFVAWGGNQASRRRVPGLAAVLDWYEGYFE